MKQKHQIMDKGTIILIIVAAILGAIILVLLFWNSRLLESTSKTSESSPQKITKTINIEQKIEEMKEKYPEIEYQSENIPDLISFVYQEEEKYQSIILDTQTGKEKTFLELIKEGKVEKFNDKEQELLKLKYPEWIVNGINNTAGLKTYYVKDREVIIFYYGFTYDYEYNETISLKIDYNEIKDCLTFTPKLNEVYGNENGYQYQEGKKAVAITFDDGPSAKYNPLILQELSKNKAHATFFMVGQMMNTCQKCVLETHKSGNEVGSHTYEHINIKRNEEEKVNNSLARTDELFYSITQEHIKLLRPPYGAYSKANLQKINNPLILWNLDTEDWRYRNVEHIVNYIKENVSDGSIILMHELYETSYESLKIILPWLYANGYQVVSVSELAKLKGRTLESGNVYLSLH